MAAKNSLDKYIDSVETYYDRLPSLPKGGRNFIVTVFPWVALIFGALGTLGAISGLGLFSYFPSYVNIAGSNVVGTSVTSLVLGLVASVFLLMAFPGLRKKKEKGWKFLYYSEVVALVSSILVFSVFGILVTLLGFYIIYQVRSYYK